MAESSIAVARTEADYAAFGVLCREYLAWCRECYADMPWFSTEIFGHQSIDVELTRLAEKYGPPSGLTMLAHLNGEAVAGGAFLHFDGPVCELKRLYVSDKARGTGLGRALSLALFGAARDAGYSAIRLDTGDRMIAAQAMYADLGFTQIAPYHDYPARLLPHLVFMERPL